MFEFRFEMFSAFNRVFSGTGDKFQDPSTSEGDWREHSQKRTIALKLNF